MGPVTFGSAPCRVDDGRSRLRFAGCLAAAMAIEARLCGAGPVDVFDIVSPLAKSLALRARTRIRFTLALSTALGSLAVSSAWLSRSWSQAASALGPDVNPETALLLGARLGRVTAFQDATTAGIAACAVTLVWVACSTLVLHARLGREMTRARADLERVTEALGPRP